MFEFYINTKVYFGVNSSSILPKLLKNEAWKRVGIIADHNVSTTAAFEKLFNSIKETCNTVVIDYCTVAEPTYDFLENIRTKFENENLQSVIGVGGGSTLDTAKAIAVLVNNRMPAISYRGFNKMTEPVLPIIAVPTTAGTGSEVTPNASFIDAEGKRKMGINGEAIRPKYAILDPEFTLSCPEGPTIASGVDSIVHAVEAYVAKKSNPIAQMFAKEGFNRVFNYLPLVVKEPHNIKHREKVMYGAFLSGVALMNSGTGPAAAMSYPLSVHLKVPHGIGGGIFLPQVIDINIKQGFYRYSDLYGALNNKYKCNDPPKTDKEKSQLLLKKMLSLWKGLSIPKELKTIGFKDEFVPQFIQETLELQGALDQNPVPFHQEEIVTTLKKLKIIVNEGG